MVLVISRGNEGSTDDVLEWLDYFGIDFIRVNLKNRIKINEISFENGISFEIEINHRKFNSSKIKAIWFRRGMMRVDDFLPFSVGLENINSIEDGLKYAVSAHSNARQEILEYLVNGVDIFKIGVNGMSRTNKVNNLGVAKSIGLMTPKTILTGNKKSLINFFNECPQGIITKSIDVNFYAKEVDSNTVHSYSQYTSEVTSLDLKKIQNEFTLTKFQEKLSKVYEIRTFFLNGKTYSQAIFTQLSEKTKIDSRAYDKAKMNRVMPFKLPDYLNKKVLELMSKLNLSTGSLDFVRVENGDFVFLEVNPVGQFGYLSISCNYPLEKEIALELCKEKL